MVLRSTPAPPTFSFLHFSPTRLDHARAVRARSVGKRRLLRISAAAHVRVVGIYARRMNAREHLSGRGLGSGHFLEPQHFRTAELTNENRFHDSSPLGSAANAPKRIHPPS